MNLDILKSNGFPPDWAEYLVGHSISFQASYLPSTSSLSKAWLKLDSQFCFLSPNSPIVLHEKDDLTPQNGSKPDRQRRVEENVMPSEGYRFSTTHWRTKNFDYVKTNIHSEGYDQAIADGFSIFDSSASGVRLFRKRF